MVRTVRPFAVVNNRPNIGEELPCAYKAVP